MKTFANRIVQSVLLAALVLVAPLPARGQKPMMVGVAGPAVNITYAYLTQDAGLWRKYGVDARVVLFESGSTLAMVVRSGEIRFAINSGPTVIAARSQGADSVMVAVMVNTLPYSLVAAKGITNWNQLKGKKVGISRFGSGTDTAIRLVAKRFGLDPVKDLVILQGGTQPSRLQAVQAGSLDATLVSPPLDLTAKKLGLSILVNIADLGIAYPQLVVETSDRYNREQPTMVKNFLKGFIAGINYAANHKEDTKKTITKYLKTDDPEILEATHRSFLEVTDYSAMPNLEGIRNAMDEVAVRMPAVKTKKPEDFIDTTFLKEIEKEGFFKQFQKKI